MTLRQSHKAIAKEFGAYMRSDEFRKRTRSGAYNATAPTIIIDGDDSIRSLIDRATEYGPVEVNVVTRLSTGKFAIALLTPSISEEGARASARNPVAPTASVAMLVLASRQKNFNFRLQDSPLTVMALATV